MLNKIDKDKAIKRAILNNDFGTLKTLISAFTKDELIDSLEKEDENKNTLFHSAVSSCTQDMISLLIGAIPKAKVTKLIATQDKDRNTALHLASTLGKTDM